MSAPVYRCRFDGEPEECASVDMGANGPNHAAERFGALRQFVGCAWVIVTADDRPGCWW